MLHAPEQPSNDIITNKIINELAVLKEHLYLVLDDYHYIHNPAIHYFIEEILRFSPSKFHLIIVTRRDSAYKIQLYRSKNLITEIRANDLCFSKEEIGVFLKKSIGENISDQTNEKITQITEGWITGVRLISLKFKENNNIDISDVETGGLNYIRIMKEEVLERLYPKIREHIIKTSILHQFNVGLCNYICGDLPDASSTNYGEEFIRSIEKSNLFIIALDDRHGWYRFHHLFQDYLLFKLKQNYTLGEISELHIKAGNWLWKNGYSSGALVHYIKAKNFEKAIHVFEKLRHELLNQTEWNELENNIRFFPSEEINNSIELRLTKCWINIYHGKPLEMFNRLPGIEEDIRELQG